MFAKVRGGSRNIAVVKVRVWRKPSEREGLPAIRRLARAWLGDPANVREANQRNEDQSVA
jgi:hypothetical protein